jgi:hypothetical protein
MSKAQRIVARVFAAILLLAAMGNAEDDNLASVIALLAAMGLVLWSMQPKQEKSE